MRIFGIFAALLLVTGMAAPAAAQKGAPVAAKAKPTAAKNWLDVVVRTPEGGFRQGNPDAKVKLIEYGARTCPTCAAFAEQGVAPLRAKYIATGKVSYEFRDFLIHGPPDVVAATVNQCVPMQRFFPVLDALFAGQAPILEKLHALEKDKAAIEKIVALPEDQIPPAYAEAIGYTALAGQLGLSKAALDKCLTDKALLARIDTVHAGGEKLGVQGTPSFLINGTLVKPYSWDTLEPLLIAAIG